jgi:hypothetical protein
MRWFFYLLAVCFLTGGTLFANACSENSSDKRFKATKEMLHFFDDGIFLQVQNQFIPVSSVFFDVTTNSYMVEPSEAFGRTCPRGHPWIDRTRGCVEYGCPYYRA